MKLLTSTALSLLLISLASVSYGQAIETINYSSGAFYVGETQRGQRHGSGTYTIVDGTVYAGEWRNNLQHGIGSVTDPDGNELFFGEFINGAAMYTLSWQEAHTQERQALRLQVTQERQALRLQVNEELSKNIQAQEFNVEEYLSQALPLVNQGDGTAIEWLTKAAEQGSPEAQYHLGYNLVRGQGIAQDEAQAEYWLTKSAEAGNIDSRRELQRSLGWTIDQVNILTVMKPRCSSFGFEEGTDGHATCVMELQIAEEALAQARELAEETQNEINQRFNEIEDARERAVAIGAAQQQAARRYEAEQRRVAEEQSRQRALGRALLSIGAGVSSGRGIGAGPSSNSGGMFQTCNYNVLGEIVPFPVRSSQICPATRDFGGVPGILRYD